MCIDGTRKFEEERDDSLQVTVYSLQLEESQIKKQFFEVRRVNTSLLEKNIPVLIVSVEKNRKGHIRQLHHQLCDLKELQSIKLILYVEHTVDAHDLPVALWRFCNNLDPKRDYITVNTPHARCVGFDGTRKTKEHDDFHRDWPNIIVADDATIKSVDEKWNQLGLGEIIPSPSLKYKEQLYGEEAVVTSN